MTLTTLYHSFLRCFSFISLLFLYACLRKLELSRAWKSRYNQMVRCSSSHYALSVYQISLSRPTLIIPYRSMFLHLCNVTKEVITEVECLVGMVNGAHG